MLVGIGLGAFGAHFLPEKLGDAFKEDAWETAVFYHLIHALALFALALSGKSIGRVAPMAWSIGILFFSGSLYGLAVTSSLPFLGPITPIGGVAFMVGWACLLFSKEGA